MVRLILRSACVGVAAVAVAGFVGGFIALSLAAMSTPSQSGEQEVGWDLITSWHQAPLWVWLIPLAAFAIGFFIGYLYFSKREARQAASK
jgi:hypothetical protein